jgi:hypothetical protein
MVPEHLKRYPTQAGREALAARLGLTIDRNAQDWEWEVAGPEHFQRWLAVYRDAPLTDDERFCLMEMLIQCVEDMVPKDEPPEVVEQRPEWQAVAELLRTRPRLHASTIWYWSDFGMADSGVTFLVSVPMRRVWAAVEPTLASPDRRP